MTRTPPEKAHPIAQRLTEHFPLELCQVMCELCGVSPSQSSHSLNGEPRDTLIRTLVRTPLTITATTGYGGAFVTRGGVRLKEVRPETLESKLQPGLYLCGEDPGSGWALWRIQFAVGLRQWPSGGPWSGDGQRRGRRLKSQRGSPSASPRMPESPPSLPALGF